MKENFKCIFYIVRHGESEGNTEGICLGQLESPMTKEGEEQVRKLANNIKNVYFDMIFYSPMLRAKRTAEIIANGRPINEDRLLKERFVGDFIQGKKETFVSEYFADTMADFEKFSDDEKMQFRFTEDGENGNETADRLLRFLKRTAEENKGKTVLVVTHSALIGAFLTKIHHRHYMGMFSSYGVQNSGYVKVVSDGNDFFVEKVV